MWHYSKHTFVTWSVTWFVTWFFTWILFSIVGPSKNPKQFDKKNVFWLVVFVFDHVKEKLELANTFIYTKYICRDCGSPFRNKMSACGDSEIKFRTTPSPFHHRKVPLKFYRDKKKTNFVLKIFNLSPKSSIFGRSSSFMTSWIRL